MPKSGDRGPVLIVGIGNELLGDEGLGVEVARSLLAVQDSLPRGVAVLEMGTSLLDAVPDMARYARLIIVDAIRAGQPAGTIYRAELFADLTGQLQAFPSISLHDWTLMDTLRAAKMLGLLPRRVTLVGAEPESIEPRIGLSPRLAGAGERIISVLLEELGARQVEPGRFQTAD